MKTHYTPIHWHFNLPQINSWWRTAGAVLLFWLNFSNLVTAQSKIWDKTYGGDDWDQLEIIQQTRDGGFIMGGSSRSGKSGDKSEVNRNTKKPDRNGYTTYDYWVVKLDVEGNLVWEKTIGGNATDRLSSLQQTQDGGYILGGISLSDKGGDKTENNKGKIDQYGWQTSDYWVVKLNANGVIIWDKTLGGTKDDHLGSVLQTPDGGYMLGGQSDSNKSGDKTEASRGSNDYWVVKLKSDGSKEWDKTYGGKQSDGFASMQQTLDGGYILGGSSISGISGDKTEGKRGSIYDKDYWIVKIKADGSKEWDKTIGGNQEDNLVSVRQSTDGNYILGGSSASSRGGEKSERNPTDFPNLHYWIVNLNSTGSKIWDKTIKSEGSILTSLELTNDGGYLLGGHSVSGITGDKSEANKGETDYWIVKVNAAGAIKWDKTIGSVYADELAMALQTKDGGYILGGGSTGPISGDKSEENVGNSINLGGDTKPFDYWIVKLDNNIRKNQNITFNNIGDQAINNPVIQLSAKASSGLPITYQVLAGPATIKGDKLTITGISKIIVSANQAGNTTYNSAIATQRFQVSLATKQQDYAYGGSKSDTLATMLPTADGGYLLGGTSASGKSGEKSQNNLGDTDFWLVKTDNNGKKLWDKSFGGSGAEHLSTLIATPDGGYLLGGSSASGKSGDKSQASRGATDYWIVKIDAQGNKLWDKSFGGSSADLLATILATPDGYLLGGSSTSGTSNDKSQPSLGKNDYWVIRLNANGQKLWDKTYGGNKVDQLSAMAFTKTGFLIGGTSSSEISGDKTQATRALADYWVLRIDNQGNKVWDRTYGGLRFYDRFDFYDYGLNSLSTIIPAPEGGFILGGSSFANKGGEKTEYKGGYNYDYWIVKVDDNGSKVWDKSYTGYGRDSLGVVVALPEGGYLLAGTSHSSQGYDKSENNRREDIKHYEPIEYANDFWLVKVDAQGNKIGDKTIGGNLSDKLSSVVLASDGSYLLAGTSFSDIIADKSTATRGEADYWVVQVKDGTRPTLQAWDMRFGGYGTDNLTTAIKTQDGGYLSGGYTNSGATADKTQGSQGKNDYWIVKSDKNGKKLWDKTFGGTQDDFLNRVIQTQDGGYLLAGSSLSGVGGDKTQASKGNRDYWIIKIDQQGNKQWDKTYGGSSDESLQKVIQLSTGEYVLGGYSNSPVSGDKTQATQGGRDYWILKTSATGTIIWDKRFGGDKDETLSSFLETADKGFLLGGTSLSGKTGDKTQGSQGASDYWVVKTDKNGSLVWEKTFGGSGIDEAYSIGTSSNNNYFIAGTSASGKSGDKSQESKGGKDYWLVTLDQNGNKIWDKSFGGNRDDELQASTFTSQGHYVLAGSSRSGISGDKTRTSQGESDYWIVTVDANGNKVQDQRFGGSGQDELRTVTQTKDGGLLLGGRSNSAVSGDKTQPNFDKISDYWLVKVAPDNTPIQAAREALPAVAEESGIKAKLVTLSVYPNPAVGKATVTFTLPETQAATLRVMDNQGRTVATLFAEEAKANQTYQLEWQTGKQVSGLYFLQLQTPTGQSTQKLLLRK